MHIFAINLILKLELLVWGPKLTVLRNANHIFCKRRLTERNGAARPGVVGSGPEALGRARNRLRAAIFVASKFQSGDLPLPPGAALAVGVNDFASELAETDLPLVGGVVRVVVRVEVTREHYTQEAVDLPAADASLNIQVERVLELFRIIDE